MEIPIVIVTRDRVTPLQQQIAWLTKAGHRRIHILDNNSSYPPLLAYLETLPDWINVHRLAENWGGFAPWRTGFIEARFPDEPYAVTDPDVVPDEDCPLTLLSYLRTCLDRYPDRVKAGPALRIDDLPMQYAHAEDVRLCERPFWQLEIEPGLYDAMLDTTLAVYRAGQTAFAIGPAIRTGAPFLARHLGWYVNTSQPSEEDTYYSAHIDQLYSAWNLKPQPRWLKQEIHLHRTDNRGFRSAAYLVARWVRSHRYYPKAFWHYQIVRRLKRLTRNS